MRPWSFKRSTRAMFFYEFLLNVSRRAGSRRSFKLGPNEITFDPKKRIFRICRGNDIAHILKRDDGCWGINPTDDSELSMAWYWPKFIELARLARCQSLKRTSRKLKA